MIETASVTNMNSHSKYVLKIKDGGQKLKFG